MQARIAKLIELTGDKVSADELKAMLEELGRTCASLNKKSYEPYINNVSGFIRDVQSEWAEKVEYDEKAKTVTIIGKKQEQCFCPMVDSEKMPKSYCDCTLGWNKEIFSTLMQTPVEVTIIESILRGGERCSCFIKAV